MPGKSTRLLLAFLICILSTAAQAADPPAFPKNSFSLDTAVAYIHSRGKGEADMAAAQVGLNYFILDNLSLGAALTGYGIHQPGDDALAVGLSGVLRHHLLQFDRATIFADVSFGPFEAFDPVPAAGTRFNFITRAGLGLTHAFSDRTYLQAGARYFHLSNARIQGVERNPSINGLELYVGLGWKL